MIIVSQDKKQIIIFKNMDIIETFAFKDKFSLRAKNRNDVYVLGKYKTEERAKEVLKGIIRAYEKAGNINFETSEDERLMSLTHNSNIFEMPKE